RWSPPEMTFPSVTSDLLMFPPSFSRTPEAPVASARSLPARSTRWILLTTRRSLRPADTRPWDWPTPPTCVKLMVKMAWERLLTSFMPVLAVVRLISWGSDRRRPDGKRPVTMETLMPHSDFTGNFPLKWSEL
uniref:Uncharacterized protein n=1 Tax=Poecilia latipinna TaxID=48699 RepID=A0A3B3TVH4_9TELE